MQHHLSKLSDEQIISDLKNHRVVETKTVTTILKYLIEVERRHLELKRGSSSIYDFCMNELGYTKHEAYFRIKAMQCLKAIPEVEEKISSGALSLTVVAKAQIAFIKKAKAQQPMKSHEKADLLNSLSNLSTREAEEKLANEFPLENLPEEKVKRIGPNATRYEFTASDELDEKLQLLKNLFAHKNFEGRTDKLIEIMADIVLEKVHSKPAKVSKTAPAPVVAQRQPTTIKKRSRYISAKVDRQLWARAKTQCEFVSAITGLRCSCKHGLQRDHILEFSRAGSNELENLQLLCGAHNRWKSGVSRYKER